MAETEGEQNISIVLNGEESELRFVSNRTGNKVHICDDKITTIICRWVGCFILNIAL